MLWENTRCERCGKKKSDGNWTMCEECLNSTKPKKCIVCGKMIAFDYICHECKNKNEEVPEVVDTNYYAACLIAMILIAMIFQFFRLALQEP